MFRVTFRSYLIQSSPKKAVRWCSELATEAASYNPQGIHLGTHILYNGQQVGPLSAHEEDRIMINILCIYSLRHFLDHCVKYLYGLTESQGP